jgi:transposase
MRADLPPLESDFTAKAEGVAPFACEHVTLTKREHIELKMQAQHWKTLHTKAVIRHQWREQRYARILREFKEQARQDRAKFTLELDEQRAKVRDLNKRVFGSKNEHKKRSEQRACTDVSSGSARGQRRGTRGHGRTLLKGLPVRHEDVSLSQSHCKHCGLEFYPLGTTEDSEIVEIEVKAYRRCVHRQRYRPRCQCNAQQAVVTLRALPGWRLERPSYNGASRSPSIEESALEPR